MEDHPCAPVVHHPRILLLGRSMREQRRVNAFALDLARWLFGEPRATLGPLARVVTAVARTELSTARRMCQGRSLLAIESAARATEALWPLIRGPFDPDEAPPPPPPPEAGDGDASGGEGQAGGLGGAGPQGEPGDTASGAGGGPGEPGEGEDSGDPSDGSSGDREGEDDAEGEEGDDDTQGEEAESEDDTQGEEAEDDEAGEVPDAAKILEQLAELQPDEELDLEGLAERLAEQFAPSDDPVEVGRQAAETLAEAAEKATDAAIEADQLAARLERFAPGVGWSMVPGQLEHALIGQLDQLSALLQNLDELRKLADALGRVEDASRRQGRSQGGREEVVGVTLSGEVAYALPSELALLADPETEDLFYQRVIEHRLISLELTGAGDGGEAQGTKRGPVIACIDTSGSMEGAPEVAAKALVLALCRKVLPQGRTLHLLLFGGQGEHTELRLRRGRGGLEGLLSFLGMSFHSGTDFDGPLLRAMDLLEERELDLADVLVVTDGLCRATHHVVERVNTVKQERGARVWSVVLGTRNLSGVAPFSDEVWELDPREAAQAAGLLKRIR